MKENTDKKISPARLSDSERADMKREFLAFMETHPAKARFSPLGYAPFFSILRSPIFYSLAIFLALGGTVYAAEGSLPQELLYPLKTDIIEPLAVQVAPLAGINKGEAHATMVGRRLQEAETLANQGALESETVALLSTKISESSDKVHSYVSEAKSDGRLDDALDAGSDLETILEAHNTILSSVVDDQASTTAQAAEDLLTAVEDEGKEAQNTSEDLVQQIVMASTTETQEYISSLLADATSTIRQLEENLQDFSSQEGALVDQAANFLRQAEKHYLSGMGYIETKEYDEALSDLREAASESKKGIILLESREDSALDEMQIATSSPEE